MLLKKSSSILKWATSEISSKNQNQNQLPYWQLCRLKAVVPLGPTPRFSNTTCTKGNTMLVTRSKVDLLMPPHKNFFDHERTPTLTCYVVAVRLTRYRSFGGTRWCFIILKSSSSCRTSLSPIFIRIFLQKRREMY